MHGWKTYTGAAIIGGAAAAVYMGWISPDQERLVIGLAAALGLIGLGHKLDKMAA
jgi:hypothetical protein